MPDEGFQKGGDSRHGPTVNLIWLAFYSHYQNVSIEHVQARASLIVKT